ncbi:hypothetical protein COCON_G00084030 [Conger conger]|uniref:Uncharacterized protein n=1 Tax=Conger conger TaxID=82655 RepID=A0A9Q1I279_CONCO|nr:hypothetical protein COCON_G00084030 [Conger conger]
MLGLLLIACMLLQAADSRCPDDPIYLVTVASQTTGGSTETVCAHILLQNGPRSFTLTLEIGPSNTTLLEELVMTEFHRCVQFQVPSVVTNTTDKPIYKPGQTIKFRIVSLDSSFLPHEEVFQAIELQDPKSNRIAQWLNQSITTGILDLSHPTTPEAKQGNYIISARTKRDAITTQTFEILEYVLPKFEVTVLFPDVIFAQDKNATIKICGKYTYGKPVLGSVKATVCINSHSRWYWRAQPLQCMDVSPARTDKTGCATIFLSVTYEVHLSPNTQYNLGVLGKLEEDGTGVVLTGSGSKNIITGRNSY